MSIYLLQVIAYQKTVWIEQMRIDKDIFIVHDGPMSTDRIWICQRALSPIGQSNFTKYLGLSWILPEEDNLCTRRRQRDSVGRLSSCQPILPS
jgi:hypothetical protein